MRPVKTWQNFIGQRKITSALELLIAGARALGHAPGSVLLLGASGLGKTALADGIAKAMQTTLHVYLCDSTLQLENIRNPQSPWAAGDVVFFDEAHNLTRPVQESLFPVLEAKKITIVAATDRPGMLASAFKKRFPLKFDMKPYSTKELTAIARQRASEMGILLTPQAARMLARTCRGTPRNARHILGNLVDYYGADSVNEFSAGHVRGFLHALGIDALGLAPVERMYLSALPEHGDRGASLQYLCVRLNCDENYLRRDVEPILVQLGFIEMNHRGRFLTKSGKEHIQHENTAGKNRSSRR